MPGFFGARHGTGGVRNVARALPVVRSIRNGGGPINELPYTIRGVTKDGSGVPLPNCPIVLFRSADDTIAACSSSDANGAYRIDASPAIAHYAVAYKVGAPDVAGTTVDTLVGTPD